ncbi:DNA/RNA non-specific endonuclease [Muriicola soli]|uniref:Endonuclease n=1 Tax=Muriicola soli TaxID=2507538 RepID=A0A411EBU4_9FLAO|nr:DNA/RNA non-specific endonuclease [Muriicola soli]QBA65003.1 DNA/RNA non-specific endonuclease [Muriicola soli]
MRKAQKNKIIYSLLLVTTVIIFWFIDLYFFAPDLHIEERGEIDIPAYVLPLSSREHIVKHNYYALSYNEEHEQADWVAYALVRSHLTNDDRKRPYFIDDPKVRTSSADWRNYKNSGYDRGHLCPAGDRRFSESAYNETFYTSNITPMERDFNAGIWNSLEIQVREWARRYDSLWIITGGVLTEDLPGIGVESVSVPEAFYKIILRGNADRPEVIAFLIPHKVSSAPLDQFRVSVDSIEKMSGLNFFESLDDKVEKPLESASRNSDWRY